MLWYEVVQVDVKVSLKCDLRSGADFENVVDCCLYVSLDCEVTFWVVFWVFWSSVQVYDGVHWVCLLLSFVDLNDACGYVWDINFVEECYMHSGFVVY